ncbi:LysR family transcriptional regulator [Rhodobacter sp. NTK016B]|uniref:LysR substrate-binding domain-containing protein n=2 Tax=Bacteria TaxID=2 RepID=UPI001A8DFD34|nr:LysR substrate-binding domain-containing protein [Rhodobacter sp. NTK016B]MBN8293772.1 LysR family transcriptional regulator [Rhodobacter sp. NTK016B]
MEHRVRMRHLRHFQEIARHKSLTRAAEALNTVQPSLSRSLAELEAELGATLFLRSPQGMVLTAEGKEFLHTIEGPLAQIGDGIARLRGAPDRPVVRIALAPAITRLLAVAALKDFYTLFPDTHVVIEARMYFDAVNRLRDGGVDFAVGRLLDPSMLNGLSFQQLFSEPIVFAANKDHPLADRRDVTLDEVNQYRIIGPEQHAIIWNEINKFLVMNGRRGFDRVIESSSYEFARTFLRHSDSIACLSRSIVRPELESGEFVAIDTPVHDMMGAVGVTYRTGARMSAPARALLTLFFSKAAEIYT